MVKVRPIFIWMGPPIVSPIFIAMAFFEVLTIPTHFFWHAALIDVLLRIVAGFAYSSFTLWAILAGIRVVGPEQDAATLAVFYVIWSLALGGFIGFGFRHLI